MKPYSPKIIPARRAGRGAQQKMGFTLVELLVVITIVIILSALSGPALVSVFSGSALNQGGQMIQDQLTLYRQLAVNNNYIVEARIYSFVDLTRPGDTAHFRGIQGFKVTKTYNTSGSVVSTAVPITKALRLPPSIIIDSGSSDGASDNISYLIVNLSSSLVTANSTYPSLFNVGTTYSYVSFQFNPDGSTNLDPALGWYGCMTLHAINKNTDDALTKSNLPMNYYTIQIDPNNGRLYVYRP